MQFTKRDLAFQMLLYSQCMWTRKDNSILQGWELLCYLETVFFPPEITCKTLSTQFLPSIFAMATCGACYTCTPSKQRALKFLGCNPICTEVENPFSSAIKSCFRERLSDPKS